jgi:hypothetical protein
MQEKHLNGTVLPFGGAKRVLHSALRSTPFQVFLRVPILEVIINESWDIENPQGVGHFFVIIDISRFVPVDEFKSNYDDYEG